jgi:hypothetical protein
MRGDMLHLPELLLGNLSILSRDAGQDDFVMVFRLQSALARLTSPAALVTFYTATSSVNHPP